MLGQCYFCAAKVVRVHFTQNMLVEAEAQLPQLNTSLLLFCSCRPISLELRQRNPWPGQVAEAGTVASVLQSCCHAASFRQRVWYLMNWSGIEVLNGPLQIFARRILDSSAILVEMPAHGTQKSNDLTLLNASMLPVSTDHVPAYPASSKNTSQLVPSASHILQQWNSAQSELTQCRARLESDRLVGPEKKKFEARCCFHCTLSFQLFWTTKS